jgi:hypothetical protein
MADFKIDQKLVESIMANLRERGCNLSLEEVATVYTIVKDEILYQYVVGSSPRLKPSSISTHSLPETRNS